MRHDEINGTLGWLERADKHDDEDCGMYYWVTLPESLMRWLVRHLQLLKEASDPNGMVFEVHKDHLIVDGIRLDVVEAQRDDPLVGVVMMRLARMYNITRMWESD